MSATGQDRPGAVVHFTPSSQLTRHKPPTGEAYYTTSSSAPLVGIPVLSDLMQLRMPSTRPTGHSENWKQASGDFTPT
jgi:hypothetical protein